MDTRKFTALFLILSVLSTDFIIPIAIAGGKGGSGHGIEMLLAAGILAKLLRKKKHGGHHHHIHVPIPIHHGHQEHHGHHHGGSGSRVVEVVHSSPSMSGYPTSYYSNSLSSASHSSPYPEATNSFSSSIDTSAYAPAFHQPIGVPGYNQSPPMGVLGYDPQPMHYAPPPPQPMQHTPPAQPYPLHPHHG